MNGIHNKWLRDAETNFKDKGFISAEEEPDEYVCDRFTAVLVLVSLSSPSLVTAGSLPQRQNLRVG